MKKLIKKTLCIVLSALLCWVLVGCSVHDGEIKEVISDFEEACNELDFNDMLDCINPRITGTLEFATGLLGMFTDTDTEEMLEELSNLIIDGESGADRKEFFSSIKITVDKIEVEDEQAVVTAVVKYKNSGRETVREATFSCEHYADEWYINTFVLN